MFGNFLKKNIEVDFSDGFNEEQKKDIVNSALTQAAKVLMTACVMTNSDNYIKGSCVFPDDSVWTITFKKEATTEKY